MAAADDARLDVDQATGRDDHDHEGPGPVDRSVPTVVHNIDRVADKVKDLLRPRH